MRSRCWSATWCSATRLWTLFLRTTLLAGTACLGSACQDDGPRSAAAQAAQVPSFSLLVPWGAGPGEAGLRAAQPDWPADGVSAIAAHGHDGDAAQPGGDGVLLLDRQNARVLWASPKGARVLAEVPADSEDLAAGPERTFVTHSLLRSRAFLFDGAVPAGELAIDRSLRELTSLQLGASRRVVVANAFQETFALGSPAAPQSLAAVLHGKRKGAYLHSDGTGVSVRLNEGGQPELWLLDNAGPRPSVRAKWTLPERVLSARVIGVVDDLACLRLEEGTLGERLAVTRRAVCHELRSGTRTFERALGAPGRYLPRRELAMASAPARLLFIRPEDKGLRVESWTLPTAEGAR